MSPRRVIAAAQQLLRRQDGATTAEYALMVSLVAIIAIGGVTLFGQSVADLFLTLPWPL